MRHKHEHPMPPKEKPKKKKIKIEWSKIFASAIAAMFGGFGIWATIRYYHLIELAITTQSAVTPDPSVATTCINIVIGALLSYLLYQAGLKNSRNKYGIDSDGQPYKQNVEYKSHEESEQG